MVRSCDESGGSAFQSAGFNCQAVLFCLVEVVEGGIVSVEDVGAFDVGQEIYKGFLALKIVELRERAEDKAGGDVKICC